MTDGLDIGQGFDVSNGSTNFGDDNIVGIVLTQGENPSFDFVGDVRNDLDGFAQVIPPSFVVDHRAVNATGGDVVGLRCANTQKALVMPQIQVRFGPVFCNITLTMLVGVERSGIYVNVGIQFLDGHPESPGLEQFGEGCGQDALAQRRGYTARNEYIFGHYGLFTGFKGMTF